MEASPYACPMGVNDEEHEKRWKRRKINICHQVVVIIIWILPVDEHWQKYLDRKEALVKGRFTDSGGTSTSVLSSMSFLHYLSFVALLAAFAFITLSLASGLLYVSELIEEHARDAKILGQRGIYAIIALHLILYVSESLPFAHIFFSIVCHVVYLGNFSAHWPFISLTSLSFLASCVLVVADHFLWFFHFARVTGQARQRAHRQGGPSPPSFAEIATFFGVCVWLAPLFLFLSLSAGDHALPTASGKEASTPSIAVSSSEAFPTTPTPNSLFKSIFSILPSFSRKQNRQEGLIAPRSPVATRPPPMSMPTSPIRSTSSSSSSLPPPPRSPRTPGGRLPVGTSEFENRTTHLSPGQDFRLGVPPPKRLTSMTNVMMSPIRRATTDGGVGLGLRRGAGASAGASQGSED